ncbi:uncharacterized protein [Apostichopus japonicus]|uniref:uncharacterized protein n=1 Tax=Stichopus japonicus TaxID=307972 RepID=UPI003AB5FCAA
MLRARRPRPPYRAYSQENLVEALNKIQNGGNSVRATSKQYNIPKTTLLDKLSGRRPVYTTQGPKPVMTPEEETWLEKWLLSMSKIGYGQTRRELCLTVKKILDDDGRKNPFKDNMPGPQWVRAFMRRHPKISERAGEALGKERAMLSSSKLEEWFAKFEEFMASDEIIDGKEILSDPRRLFNCDESGFPLVGKAEKVLAPRGTKNVYQFSNSDKHQMNAAGFYIEPMLIFPNTRFRYNPLDGAPDTWCVGRIGNGWMNSEVFYEWITNHFVPEVQQKKIPFDIVLFIDGHSSHVTYATATFCAENEVILYCLPAHSSHVLQPCDLSLFKSLKSAWKIHTKTWKANHVGQTITKMQFASVFAGAWKSASTVKNANNGFESAGLFPLDSGRFDRDKLIPSSIFLKSPDSTPQTGTTAVLAAGCSIAKKSTAYETALRVLEESMTEEKVWLFKRRLNEGYDFDTDTLYNAWKKIKLQADGSNTNNIQAATGSNTTDEVQAATGINTDNFQAATSSNTIDDHHHAITTPSPAAKKRTNVSEALVLST